MATRNADSVRPVTSATTVHLVHDASQESTVNPARLTAQHVRPDLLARERGIPQRSTLANLVKFT